MSNPNLHIKEFLEYYYSFDKEPGYAVLLKGKWGTGKTWFINQTLKSLEEQGGRHLYVSLYGVTSFDEIEDEFFKQLHPLLSSKSMALTGKITKGLLKATLKIDLDGDGKADSSLTAQAPDLNLPDYLTNTSGFVIIFDDLERASINLDSLLGYINHYVEHQGYKVIIVANEEEILDQQEKKEDFKHSYRRIKEKLVGKTFEIEPDLQGALTNLISDIENDDIKSLYESNIELISELYNNSAYQNLRHLKQALWDFERLASFITEDAWSKGGLLLHLLKLFLVLSFEIKSGSILPKDIAGLKTAYFSSFVNQDKQKKEDTPYQKVSKKYKNVSLSDLLLEESIWVDFFDRGCCSKEKIKESLEKSEYYRTENTPDWVKLWNSMDLSDEEFNNALTSVETDFFEKKFEQVGVVKHVTGIFLWLSKINLFSKKKSEILEFSCSYINHLKEQKLLNGETYQRLKFRENEAWGGLGFHEKDSEEFKDLNKHIDKLSEQAVIEDYPEAGSELINLIETDADLFYRRVVLNNNSDNIYYKIPIFKHVDKKKFVDAFVKAKPNSRNIVCYAFSERYKLNNFNDSLLPELDWLKGVVKLIEEKRQLLDGKISGYQLQSYINNHFVVAIEALEQYEANRVAEGI